MGHGVSFFSSVVTKDYHVKCTIPALCLFNSSRLNIKKHWIWGTFPFFLKVHWIHQDLFLIDNWNVSLALSNHLLWPHIPCFIKPYRKKYNVLEKISVTPFYYINEIIRSIDDKNWIYIHIVKAVTLCEYFHFLVLCLFHALRCLPQDCSLCKPRRHYCILWEYNRGEKRLLVLQFYLET